MKWEDVDVVLPPHWDKVILRFNNGEENLGMRNPHGVGWISFITGTGTKVTHWSYADEIEDVAQNA